MEDIVGAMNYSSLDEMCSEEANFMAQLLVKESADESTSNLWENIMYESNSSISSFNPHVFPFPTPYPHHDNGISYHHNLMSTMDYCNNVMDDVMLDISTTQQQHVDDDVDVDVDVVIPSKKRSRAGDVNIPVVPRNRRGGAKRPKIDNDDDDDDDDNKDAVIVKKSRCSDSLTTTTTNSTSSRAPKTRAGRGSATDPQSLYARKRRERINERLKVLQKLVPNGTKVDISTMLEEAVQYVKFLQLQIKLLSSDDLWMYAPIAYNGMDIGALNS